jgi:hypothetical protein
MIKDLGKYIAMKSVPAKHGHFLPRGIVVHIRKVGGMTIADTGSVKVKITNLQLRHDFIQYALAETVAAESQAVR